MDIATARARIKNKESFDERRGIVEQNGNHMKLYDNEHVKRMRRMEGKKKKLKLDSKDVECNRKYHTANVGLRRLKIDHVMNNGSRNVVKTAIRNDLFQMLREKVSSSRALRMEKVQGMEL